MGELESFSAVLRARARNQFEDVRLKHLSIKLDQKWNQTKMALNNKLYEERHFLHTMKKEAIALKKVKEKEKTRNEDGLNESWKLKEDVNRLFLNGEKNIGDSSWRNRSIDQNDIKPVESVHRGYANPLPPEVIPQKSNQTTIYSLTLAKCTAQHMSESAKISKKPALLPPPLKGRSPVVDQHTSTTSGASKTLWVGDPRAIASIRRPRLSAKEMSTYERNMALLRKMNRDMTDRKVCSRGCNRFDSVDLTLLGKDSDSGPFQTPTSVDKKNALASDYQDVTAETKHEDDFKTKAIVPTGADNMFAATRDIQRQQGRVLSRLFSQQLSAHKQRSLVSRFTLNQAVVELGRAGKR